MKNFIGIDFGGTNIKIGCFDEQLKLLVKISIPTEADKGPERCFSAIKHSCDKMLSDNGISSEDTISIGIGVPGPVDLHKGMLVSPPNLPLFHGYPVRETLSKLMGKPVVMENDANAAAWAEHICGVGKDVDNMVFATLGTGIGGGVIANGKIVHGHSDAGGELGHIIIYPDGRKCGCGQYGCAEAYASSSSTEKRAMELLEQGAPSSLQEIYKSEGKVTCRHIYDHAAEGDEFAFSITEGTDKVLGLFCVNAMNFTDPAKIVFAGGMIGQGDQLLDRIRYYFKKYAWPGRADKVEIIFATVGKDAGIIGTAALAKTAELN